MYVCLTFSVFFPLFPSLPLSLLSLSICRLVDNASNFGFPPVLSPSLFLCLCFSPFPHLFFSFLSFFLVLSLSHLFSPLGSPRRHAFLPLPIPEKQTMCKGGRKEEEVVVGLEEEEEGKVEGTPSTSSLLSQRSCQKYNERVKRERRRYSERGEGGRGRGGKGGMPFFLHLPPGTF